MSSQWTQLAQFRRSSSGPVLARSPVLACLSSCPGLANPGPARMVCQAREQGVPVRRRPATLLPRCMTQTLQMNCRNGMRGITNTLKNYFQSRKIPLLCDISKNFLKIISPRHCEYRLRQRRKKL
jgi:hypothetical protein